MPRTRIITGTITLMAAGALAAPSFGATPREIAADLADGRLDGAYTQQELESYLKDATVQGYQPPVTPTVTPTSTPAVTPTETPAAPASGVAGVATPPGQAAKPASPATTASQPAGVAAEQKTLQQPLTQTAEVSSLPFTGLDLALLVFGGFLLLLLGFGARRLGRQRA